eukprot:688357-Heterocapsa_arctica.AAC.1
MEIQVNEQGIAQWQCELCDDEMTWLEYRQLPAWMWPTSRQLPAWMWPTSAGSSATSTRSGSAAPAARELEDTADPPQVTEPGPTT